MQRLPAFKYEFKPDGGQQRNMRRYAGSCRFVYNKALALQQANHEAGGKYINHVAMEWLKDTPAQPLQQALKGLEKAHKNFFARRAGFPRFRRKGSGGSFRYPDPKQIQLDQANSRIFLPKLGWVRYRNSRDVLGELRNVTVSSNGGKWFVSIQTRREVGKLTPTATTSIGIDLGIARFATFSDGSHIAPLSSFKIQQARLAKYQRRMAHKQKFSNNWKKSKAKVQKLHTQIANARRDFLHKATATISQNHALVFVEDLQVSNMSQSAAGPAENPGKNVAAVVGAINVLERGHRLLACGDGAFSAPMKQEPTEGGKLSGLTPVRIPVIHGGENVKIHALR